MRYKSNMSTTVDSLQKLQQDLQLELINTNELLMSISEELHQIKSFTSSGGEFESTIKQNASLMATLANIQKLDIENLPPVARTQIDLSNQTNEKASYEQRDSFRSRDESQ